LKIRLNLLRLTNPTAAKKFKNDILIALKSILPNPYLYRKSIYFEDDFIRDYIFKGYTIVFRIAKMQIEVFGFVKFQEKPNT